MFAARLSGLLAAVATGFVMSSALTPGQRGTVASFAILQMIGSVAAGLGTGLAAYVLVGQEPRKAGRLVGVALVWAAATAGLILVVGAALQMTGALRIWLGAAADWPLAVPLLALGAAGQYLSVTLTQLGAGQSRTGYVAMGFALAPFALMIGTVVAAWLLADPGGYMLVQALAWVVAASCLMIRFGTSPSLDGATVRTLARRGLAAAPGDVANALSYRLDALILGAISGQAAVGIYSLAVQVLEPLWIVATAVTNGLLIEFPKMDPDRWPRATRRGTAIATILTAIGVAGVAAVLPTLLTFIGPAYAPTATVAVALAPGIVFLAGSKVLAAYQVANGRFWLSSAIAGASLAVTTMMDLLLMPANGAIGASLASSFGYGVSVLLWIGCFRRYRAVGSFSVAPRQISSPS